MKCKVILSRVNSINLILENNKSKIVLLKNEINEKFRKENGNYFYLATKKFTPLAKLEGQYILPVLYEKWELIQIECCKHNFHKAISIIKDIDVKRLYRNALSRNNKFKPNGDHTHFEHLLLNNAKDVITLINEYILENQKIGKSEDCHIERKKLFYEIDEYFVKHLNLKIDIEKIFNKKIPQYIPLQHISLAVMKSSINSILWFIHIHFQLKKLPAPHVFKSSLVKVCETISSDKKIDESLIKKMIDNQLIYELNIVFPQKYENDSNKFIQNMHKQFNQLKATPNISDELIADIEEYLKYNHFSLAHEQISNNINNEKILKTEQNNSFIEWAKQELISMNHKMLTVESENEDIEWVEKLKFSSDNIHNVLLSIIRGRVDITPDFVSKIKHIISIFSNIVENNSKYLKELESLVDLLNEDKDEETDQSYNDRWLQLNIDNDNILVRKDTLNLWQNFSNNISMTSWSTDWGHFVKGFSKLTGLLFGQATEVVNQIKIGDGECIPGRETKFRSSKHSSLFHKTVCLYLLPGSKPKDVEIKSLKNCIEKNREEDINIIIIPGAEDRAIRLFDSIHESHNIIFCDNKLFDQILRADDPGIILRQNIIKTKSLTSVDPFVSSGRVLSESNIFVGRKNALEKLYNKNFCWICGGRRIGKTSLLHRFAERLKNSNTKKWLIASVNAQHIKASQNADLLLCKDICRKLNWEWNSEIEDFRIKLCDELSEHNIAILIDEMDNYIAASHNMYGDEYPLARNLRSVAQDAPSNKLKIVYAGFKKLFEVSEMKETQDLNYPFKQFLTRIKDLNMLNTSETDEIVENGFRKTLGIDYAPSVPRKIYEITGGHPAFVQEFCSRLLERFEKRQRNSPLFISDDDVAAVFDENQTYAEQKPFIEFINETLKWNLSPLERILFLIIGIERKLEEFTEEESLQLLNEYIDIVGVDAHKFDIKKVMQLLVMTGMFIKIGNKYKIALSSYIGILERLNEYNKSLIEDLIIEYAESMTK